jgi:hypothetical protein
MYEKFIEFSSRIMTGPRLALKILALEHTSASQVIKWACPFKINPGITGKILEV